ncbi:MAG TPA: DNA repair protein RadA [Candidatus Kapabacteria bacterium]|nr:DNA repair protein RadA [Candidatus Kapabacteria bacterium]
MKKIFVCTNCDAQYQKWIGRCLECGTWGKITEQLTTDAEEKKKASGAHPTMSTTLLKDVEGKDIHRMQTRISELDRVFGGGIVPGSLTLLGGEPGIGKSTLALQLAVLIPHTLYISGEESAEQIKLRSDRLFTTPKETASLRLGNDTCIESICATIEKEKPSLAIIDSIQTIYSEEATGEPGNVTQVRACTVKLLETAKTTRTSIILIGHVTKDGAVAGPKTLEHLVDTVLYLEGDRHHSFRILRGTKNRFGSTDEIGIFDMTSTGLVEVPNASATLLKERGENMSGSIVTCLLEGTRPMLLEIQALVNKTTFGYPVRKASGFDVNRLHVLIAVLQKRAGMNLAQYDVHINVVGGIKANEPAADLAVCLAVASAYKDKILGNDVVCFGEVGLGGEIRSVRATDKRMKECEQLGMKRVILPKAQKDGTKGKLQIVEVNNIQDLIKQT